MATLYRKYRPKTFDDVVEQDSIVTTLTNQIKLGRIGHAYLFTGSRGTGKTSCARIFARAVNCLHPVNGSPCGECEACKKLDGDNVDIVEMDAASNNGVDDARDIREKVKYLPVACKYKVYIIDEVHMLTGGAFNALLKTIEEPPEHVIFILATTEPHKLPQTILSRCIRFDFRLVSTPALAAHIAKVYDREGIKYTEDAVEEIARLGAGSVRDALSVADTLMSAADIITADVVLSLTGSGDYGRIAQLFECTADRDLAGALETVDAFAKSGKSMSAVCRQLIDYTRNVLVAKSVGSEKAEASGLINADSASLKKILGAVEKHSMTDISRMLEQLSSAESGLKYSVNPRVFLETALVKLVCGAQREDDLLKRISALERNSAGSAEQKKNKVEKERQDADIAVTPVVLPAEPKIAKRQPAFDPPPPEYMPEPEPPVQDEYFAPPPAPVRSREGERAAKAATANTVQPNVADEGEFWHLRAQNTEGLELLGRIARSLRKSDTPISGRIRQLLARGVSVKEREDAIAFVTPEDCFLSMSEDDVLAALDGVLDGLGIKKRARIERTADDLYEEDVKRAYDLFGRDCVVRR